MYLEGREGYNSTHKQICMRLPRTLGREEKEKVKAAEMQMLGNAYI